MPEGPVNQNPAARERRNRWPRMTHADFLQSILADPDNDGPRLVYADWLDENGDGARAEFIRLQIESARLHAAVARWSSTPSNKPGGSAEDGGKAGAQLAMAQTIDRRAHMLWKKLSPLPWPYAFLHQLRAKENTFKRWMLVSRGFVESITLSWPDWLTHAAAILAATPLREVTLTTRPNVWHRSDSDEDILAILADDWPGITFHLPEMTAQEQGEIWAGQLSGEAQ